MGICHLLVFFLLNFRKTRKHLKCFLSIVVLPYIMLNFMTKSVVPSKSTKVITIIWIILRLFSFSNFQNYFSLKLRWKSCPITTHRLLTKSMILSQKEPKIVTKKWQGMGLSITSRSVCMIFHQYSWPHMPQQMCQKWFQAGVSLLFKSHYDTQGCQ